MATMVTDSPEVRWDGLAKFDLDAPSGGPSAAAPPLLIMRTVHLPCLPCTQRSAPALCTCTLHLRLLRLDRLPPRSPPSPPSTVLAVLPALLWWPPASAHTILCASPAHHRAPPRPAPPSSSPQPPPPAGTDALAGRILMAPGRFCGEAVFVPRRQGEPKSPGDEDDGCAALRRAPPPLLLAAGASAGPAAPVQPRGQLAARCGQRLRLAAPDPAGRCRRRGEQAGSGALLRLWLPPRPATRAEACQLRPAS
jgi:hypothetical protein